MKKILKNIKKVYTFFVPCDTISSDTKRKEEKFVPKEVKITKEKILEAAFKIVKEQGLERLSNREIAKKLKCSIRPIYYQFKNVEELKRELYLKIENYFYIFLMDKMTEDIPKYKQIGIRYVDFARKEKNLFKILFMSKSEFLPEEFVAKDGKDFEKIRKIIKMSTNLTDEDINSFHIKMWIFTHGVATLVASSTVKFEDEQVKELLSLEFQALMLLKENPNNDWVLNGNNFNIK